MLYRARTFVASFVNVRKSGLFCSALWYGTNRGTRDVAQSTASRGGTSCRGGERPRE
ncbi:protein of unknown function [Streptomyces sp. KY75]|nr:protein of unknown function [Streptomyces sp. KY75]CAD5989094.1 protein of unknown function [Streptomyces sp. KY70]